MLPQLVLDKFAYVPADTTNENEYGGAYTALLCTTFHPILLEPYMIWPHYPLDEEDPAAERVSFIVVTLQYQPLFVLQLYPPGHINLPSTRIAADNKMRRILHSVCPETVVPKFHGISAMGQKLAFYSMDTISGRVHPDRVPTAGDGTEIDIVPANRWELDITTEAGHERFLKVINDVKSMDRNRMCQEISTWLNNVSCTTQ
ncbi:hypothetical protein EV424DRAFT_1543209 [Suillus variegatus]|nr:hypothetical protein EV424DRAFT_1543209 [Suillus variegatus]